MHENQIGTSILDAAFAVHRRLGPGLLEKVYHTCLEYELSKTGLFVQSELSMPVFYDGLKLNYGYRIDLMIDNKVIVEVKSVDFLNDIHLAQVLTYIKLANVKLGYLLNFNVPYLKNGIRRVVVGDLKNSM